MRLLISCAATGLVLAAFVQAASPALAEEGEKATSVLNTELQGMEGQEANIILYEVEPGFETERHIHPGHVFGYVLEGAIQIDVEGEEPETFSAGEAFHELPDKPMVGRNASASEGARFVIFQVGPVGEPLMVVQPQ